MWAEDRRDGYNENGGECGGERESQFCCLYVKERKDEPILASVFYAGYFVKSESAVMKSFGDIFQIINCFHKPKVKNNYQVV